VSGLLFKRRFWPLFGAQAFGAFADNALRNATIIAVIGAAGLAYGDGAFTMPWGLGIHAGSVVSIGFTLPVLLFSVIAGQLADKVDRRLLVRRLKLLELGLMAFAALCFALGNAPALIFALFLMGTQSAFFSPVRNALMPHYYTGSELPRANGYFNAALFVALVVGLALGGWLMTVEGGRLWISSTLIAAAAIGAGLAHFCPPAPAPGLDRIDWNVPKVAVALYRETARRRGLLYPMLGIGWFWMIGAATLALLPSLVKESLGASEVAVNLCLVISALGAGIGSIIAGLVASRLKDGFGLAGIGVAINAVAFAVTWLVVRDYAVPQAFFSTENLPLILCLFATAASNGVFVVPLMAALQARAPLKERARIMGTSNMTNGGLATFGAAAIVPPLSLGLSPDHLLVGFALLQAALLAFMWRRRRRIRDDGRAATASPLTGEAITPTFDAGSK
jgi:MFS family permease